MSKRPNNNDKKRHLQRARQLGLPVNASLPGTELRQMVIKRERELVAQGKLSIRRDGAIVRRVMKAG